MTTLQNLRTLLDLALTHTENPALGRCERTVHGIAVEYLGETLAEAIRLHETENLAALYWVRMDKPARFHALLVALALAHGLDPGVGGIGVSWLRCLGSDNGKGAWQLYAPWTNRPYFYVNFGHVAGLDRVRDMGRYLGVPLIAVEPNPIVALEAAVKHTLEANRATQT